MKRKHISWKTRCASLLLQLGDIPYSDGKQMTEDQILSLYHLDHNMLHSSLHEDRDKFWNFTHLLIKAHREKTKADAKIIAKSKRIRAKLRDAAGAGNLVAQLRLAPLRTGPDEAGGEHFRIPSTPPLSGPHKIQSRGFDKTRSRKMSGKVVKRER